MCEKGGGGREREGNQSGLGNIFRNWGGEIELRIVSKMILGMPFLLGWLNFKVKKT